MEKDGGQILFRKKTLDRIASPEQLTAYLRVTAPGIWAVLAAVILLLAGLLAWSSVGTLETTAEARAIVQGGMAEIVLTNANSGEMAAGMPVRIASQDITIVSIRTDDDGRMTGIAKIALPDGIYDAEVITERIHPIDFLIA